MSNVVTAAKSIKESSSYMAISASANITQTPISIIQVAGVIIGAGGLVVAVMRWRVAYLQQKETKRANDLNREKWEFEKNAKSKNVSQTEGK